jgi:hypothetical protein
LVWCLDTNGLTMRLAFDDGPAEEIDSVLVRSTGWLDPAGWEPADEAIPTLQERIGFPLQRRPAKPAVAPARQAATPPR